jgi:hypothetical protein
LAPAILAAKAGLAIHPALYPKVSAALTPRIADNQNLTEFRGQAADIVDPPQTVIVGNRFMSRKLARLPATSDETGPERRRSARHPAWGTARLQSSHGENCEAMLADLSTHGCCVISEVTWLRTGTFVTIGIAEEPPLAAIVRWVRDGSVGMEFLRPIPPERSEWHTLLDSPFGP